MKYFLLFLINKALCLNVKEINLAIDYFEFKNVDFVTYFSCERQSTHAISREFINKNLRISSISMKQNSRLERILYQGRNGIGILTQGSCDKLQILFNMASKLKLFDVMHIWLAFPDVDGGDVPQFIAEKYQNLNLSVDADIAVVADEGDHYSLTDVFNFGKIQGNKLETVPLGTWREESGLNIFLKGFKYYNRWDFHNLTLRAISVVLDQQEDFDPKLLSAMGYTPGINAITKIASQQLDLIKEAHNFRFNYTMASVWIGAPERNSTLAVTNSLFWEEQDISCTSVRAFIQRLQWVDILFPPVTHLETRFFYLIPDKGIGDYENRFLTPMSPDVWWSTLGICGICVLVLAASALRERRNEPGTFAFFSVFAALCQQEYEDGIQVSDEQFTSQSRKLTLLTVGLTSMLLYNYYTSSVVSWLLSAAPPSIADLDALINSDLELIFEDIGYTRGWLDSPGFFYYSGYDNPKEDILREKKVTHAKRTLDPLQPVETGLQLIRSGKYAYHTEPYIASQVISKTFEEKELCELGSLPMMLSDHSYILSQRRSPYKQFFVWSLMRLKERGHLKATQARFAGTIPPCPGSMPRALALGQAAPAFALLIEAAILSLCMLMWEIIWSRMEGKRLRLKQTCRRGKKRSHFNP